MKRFISNLVLTIILIALLIALGVVGFLGYNDAKASEAKKYLEEKYGLTYKDYLVIKYVEYVNKDTHDCSTLWLKKCADDTNLAYQYTLMNKDKDKILITEYADGSFEDDYDGKVLESWIKQQEELNEVKEETEKNENQ